MRCENWRRIQKAQQTACVAGVSLGVRDRLSNPLPKESAEKELVQCGAACPGLDYVCLGQNLPCGVCDQLNLIERRGR
jgi:hypothetical protein